MCGRANCASRGPVPTRCTWSSEKPGRIQAAIPLVHSSWIGASASSEHRQRRPGPVHLLTLHVPAGPAGTSQGRRPLVDAPATLLGRSIPRTASAGNSTPRPGRAGSGHDAATDRHVTLLAAVEAFLVPGPVVRTVRVAVRAPPVPQVQAAPPAAGAELLLARFSVCALIHGRLALLADQQPQRGSARCILELYLGPN